MTELIEVQMIAYQLGWWYLLESWKREGTTSCRSIA